MNQNHFQAGRWCILRTRGSKTLALARSLSTAGYGAWTPIEAALSDPSGKGQFVRIERSIMPTFVFAKDEHVLDLLRASADPACRHPQFSVFRRDDRVPLIGMRDVRGLLDAQEESEARCRSMIEARDRRKAREERAAMLRTDAATRKAMRAQPLPAGVRLGTWVEVKDAPALTGLSGQIVEERNNAAVVMFGGSMRMLIEAWQILPIELSAQSTRAA